MLDLSNLADVKPSVLSFITVGLLAIAFIVIAKYVVNAYQNPVTDLFRDTINSV